MAYCDVRPTCIVGIVAALGSVMMLDARSADSQQIASADLQKDKVQVEALRIEAVNGNLAASNELEKYYGVFVADEIQSEFWMRLSGELGDCGDISELIRRSKSKSFLATKREPDVLQVKYWTERWEANDCSVGK